MTRGSGEILQGFSNLLGRLEQIKQVHKIEVKEIKQDIETRKSPISFSYSVARGLKFTLHKNNESQDCFVMCKHEDAQAIVQKVKRML